MRENRHVYENKVGTLQGSCVNKQQACARTASQKERRAPLVRQNQVCSSYFSES